MSIAWGCAAPVPQHPWETLHLRQRCSHGCLDLHQASRSIDTHTESWVSVGLLLPFAMGFGEASCALLLLGTTALLLSIRSSSQGKLTTSRYTNTTQKQTKKDTFSQTHHQTCPSPLSKPTAAYVIHANPWLFVSTRKCIFHYTDIPATYNKNN